MDSYIGAGPESSAGGENYMACAGAQAYMGVWGLAPRGVQGQSPWSGVRGTKSPEADALL